MQKKFYSLEQTDRTAHISIYGDITSMPWLDSDVSAYRLSQQIERIDADEINVYLNSYGGEVSEGWAIYNALVRHKANVHTFADGFACSIASVIFMAGQQRTMSPASLLMIHQPSCGVHGTAEQLRKEADTLDTIGELSAAVYRQHVTLSEDELKAMLDLETWLAPAQAVQYGFATDLEQESTAAVTQSARDSVLARLTRPQTQTIQKPKAVTLSDFFNFNP